MYLETVQTSAWERKPKMGNKRNLRELEWWRSPELEVKLRFSTFMDIHHGYLTIADAHTGHFVDDLGDIFVCLAFTTCSVTDSGNGEFTGALSNAAEACALRSGFSLSTIERIEHFKRGVA